MADALSSQAESAAGGKSPAPQRDWRKAGVKGRSIRNILVDPFAQVQLGLYSIFITLIFSAAVAGILYENLSKFAVVVIALTDVESEVKTLFAKYMTSTWLWLLLSVIGFVLLNIAVSVFFTHRLVGPSVAFIRQINALIEGNYSARVRLRRADSFRNVADKLNELAAKLESAHASKGDAPTGKKD